MPIKGLTDRPAAFPEIGRIRKGAPKETNKPGKDLTYFRVEFDEEEKQATAIFHKTYGGTPSELNILLPFNSVDENFDAWREAYVAGGLVHRCDGERVWYENDPESGEQLVVNRIPEEQCDRSSGCKPTGRLKVLIPELQRLAYLTVLTGSTHDVMNIARQLEALLQINGKLAGVPLKLRRRPVKISTPSGTDGKRARRTKSLLSIEADPEWVRHKLLSMKAAALPDNGLEDLPALEAPDEEDWTEGEIVEAEEKKTTKAKGTKKQKPDTKGKTVIRVKNQWEDDVIQTIMDLGLAKAKKHIVNRLNPSIFMTTVSYEELTEQDAVAYMLAWDDAQGKYPDEETKERAARVDNNYIEFVGKAIELLTGDPA